MITYELNTKKNILETIFSDLISPTDIFEFMKEINHNKDLPRKLNVLVDVRQADFVFEPNAIQHIVKANFRLNKSFKKINNAILANNPNDTTLVLFKYFAKGSRNYQVEIFNDRDMAESWLSNNW